jgi:PAS domain-containing protein
MKYQKVLGIVFSGIVALIIAVALKSEANVGYEAVWLLPVLNTLFIGIFGIISAYIVAKIYLDSQMNGLLLMGSGILIFALGAITSGWLRFIPDGANVSVTIYNTSAMLGSALHASGALLGFRNGQKKISRKINAQKQLFITYVFACLMNIALTTATLFHLTPLFFIQGVGPTLLRQTVLWISIILYFSNALVFFSLYVKSRFDYLFWYALSMGMNAMGLFVVSTVQVVGSLGSWSGRLALFFGGIYALVSVLSLIRIAKSNEVTLGKVVNNFFIDSETNYKNLTESLSDSIISVDNNYVIFFANTAAERLFGYNKIQLIGIDFLNMLVAESYAEWIRRDFQDENLILGKDHKGVFGPIFGKTCEIEVKTKTYSLIPVELSLSED